MGDSSLNGKSIAFVTMGCAKNEVDSEHMAARLANAGYAIVDDPEAADGRAGQNRQVKRTGLQLPDKGRPAGRFFCAWDQRTAVISSSTIFAQRSMLSIAMCSKRP